MNEMRASLIVTADGSQLVTENAKMRGSLAQLVEANTGVGRAFRSAGESAEVFQRETREADAAVDRLRAGLDPAFAATQRFSAGERTLAAALRAGSIDVRERDRLLGLLTTEMNTASAAQTRFVTGQRSLMTATRGGAGGLQNVGFQVQDFAVQVGAGTAASVALGQQLPQLLSGFGLIGVLAGTATAVLLPLGAILLRTGEDADEAGDRIADALGDAGSAISALSTLNGIAQLSVRDLREEYGQLSNEVVALTRAQIEFQTGQARQSVRNAFDGILDDLGLPQTLSELDAVRARLASVRADIEGLEQGSGAFLQSVPLDLQQALRAQEEVFDGLRDDLGLTSEQAEALAGKFVAVREALDDTARAEAFTDLIDQIGTALGGLEELPPEAGAIIAPLLEAADRARELAGETTGVGSAAVSAAADVDLITDAFGRATRAAQATIAAMGSTRRASFGALEDANIRLAGRGDPVGTAGNLAVAQFRRQNELDRADLATPSQLTQIARQEREIRTLAEAAAAAQEELRALNDLDRDTAAAERSGSSAATREADRLAKEAERDRERTIADIAKQIDAIAPSYTRDILAAEAWREEALANLDPARDGYELFAADVQTIFRDQIGQAYKDDLDRRTDWQAGLARGLLELEDGLGDWASTTEDLVTGWGEGLEDVFVNFARTGKVEVGDLVDFTLSELSKLAYQQSIQPAVSGVVDLIAGGIGSLFAPGQTVGNANALSGLSGSQLLPPGYSHAGSTIGESDLRATGAALRNDERLTVTRLGQRVFTPRQIENGSAVVDALAMAASRPVVIDGGGRGDINIHNYGDNEVEARRNDDGGVTIDIMAKIESDMAGRVSSGRGPLANSISQTYGLSRKMAGRT